MRILIVGAIQGGTVPLGKTLTRAFRANSQEVVLLDYSDLFDEFNYIRSSGNNEKSIQFFIRLKIRLLEKVISFRPDVIFGMAQSPLNDVEILDGLKKSGIILCYWFTEDFQIFDYWKSIAPCFDYFFTIQQHPFRQELEKMGLNNYHYLPMAFDDLPVAFDDGKIALPRKESDIRVSFVGAPYPNRVYLLPQIYSDIEIYGEEWSKYQSKSIITGNRRISEMEVHQIYLHTQVNINLHSSINPTGFADGDFVNPRTFEIAGLGAFQLTDMRRLLSLHFDLNEEIVALTSLDEMKEAVNYFLTHETERLLFAQKAQKRVLDQHTYRHRAAEIIKLLR